MRNGKYELIVPPPEYPGKRYRGKYAYEHRVNWWKEHNQNPDDYDGCIVHHKNDHKRDNDPVNLELMESIFHLKHHHPKTAKPKRFICINCEVEFERFIRGKVQKFCSRRCMGLYGSHKGTFRRNNVPVNPSMVHGLAC
jgi:hypothetical protein